MAENISPNELEWSTVQYSKLCHDHTLAEFGQTRHPQLKFSQVYGYLEYFFFLQATLIFNMGGHNENIILIFEGYVEACGLLLLCPLAEYIKHTGSVLSVIEFMLRYMLSFNVGTVQP